jgi:hypothetical protein
MMNHFSTTRNALLLLSALSPLDAGAFYCSTLTYTGASLLPGGGHQYTLTGNCLMDPTGLGHLSQKAIEKATLSWNGGNQASEEFLLTFDGAGALKQRTVIEYSCSKGDPWQTQKAVCKRISCNASLTDLAGQGQWLVDKKGCPANKLNSAVPTTRHLVPTQAKYSSADPQAFYFVKPGMDNATVPMTGSTYLQLGLRKDVAANLSVWPDKDSSATISANLSWTGPNKIAYAAWPGQAQTLPGVILMKGAAGFDFVSSAIPVTHNSFPNPGLWTVKACIDQAGFKGCTERKLMVVQSPRTPLSGGAPVSVNKSLPGAIPPGAASAPGNNRSLAAPTRGAQPTVPSHQQAGTISPRLNPQPAVASPHSGFAPANPAPPAVQPPVRPTPAGRSNDSPSLPEQSQPQSPRSQ